VSKKQLGKDEEVRPMRVVVYSDIHAPFQDDRAVELVNKFCRWYQPEKVVIDGDLIDFYAISKFDKSPRRATGDALTQEVAVTQRILKSIRQANPNADITLVCGN
jgi:predicted phosphodiesterase